MEAINKWNKGIYKVIEIKDGKVILERQDGSRFIIAKSEYYANYSEKSS